MSKSTPDPAAARVLKPAELNSRHLVAWRRIIAENPQLSSPFFSPEYNLAVARVIPNVLIGILEQDGAPVAFLPFERCAGRIGKRLRLCDYQGLVSMPELAFDIRWFIRKCGLRAWDFDHLLAKQEVLRPFHCGLGESSVIDLSIGFEAYVAERRAAGTEQIKKSGNLERRLEREHGQLRFALHVEDPALLGQLLEWRSSKYQVSRHRPEIVASILKELLLEQSTHCQGTLSVLYVNDVVTACHFGLRSSRAWHYWFPAYNPDFEKYSPGNILLIKMAEIAPKLGITTIDLGKGEQDYKKRFANRWIPIAEGYVSASSWLSLSRKLERESKRCLRRTPILYALARKIHCAASGG
ncbi:MAG: GNAT family N-acetyltransferase [Verrucomicrobia bacterium]|nr:GNAT family N-acetyltransferase [Verrucomicrobiota bacterium]